MHSENRLCSICKKAPVEVFCLCMNTETFLCAGCIGSHTIKVAGRAHTNWPINQLLYYKIPGYAERLQVRTELYPQVRAQVLQCVQVTDGAIQEFTESVERTMWEAVQYSKQIVKQLSSIKEELRKETEAALEEVESTLVEDQPHFTSQYGRVFRNLTESLKPFQLFSYSFTTSAPHSIFALQCKRYPPMDIYIQELAEGDAYVGNRQESREPAAVSVLSTEKGKYEGPLQEGKPHGYGIETWPNGTRYEGYYASGKKHGKGSYQWANGDTYTGDFFEDTCHGRGEYLYADGRIYDGDWKRNQMHGDGNFTWPDGRYYEGKYCDHKKQGFGLYLWPDGRKYEGLWLNGKQHGQGVYVSASGVQRTGEWQDGKRTRWLDDS